MDLSCLSRIIEGISVNICCFFNGGLFYMKVSLMNHDDFLLTYILNGASDSDFWSTLMDNYKQTIEYKQKEQSLLLYLYR